jgi:hypothetical protein
MINNLKHYYNPSISIPPAQAAQSALQHAGSAAASVFKGPAQAGNPELSVFSRRN